MVAEWRPVGGYEGLYEVSSHGQVRSLDRIDALGRMRKGRTLRGGDSKGYRNVLLSKNGITRTFTVHNLVARAFLTGDGDEIRHCDGDRTNNRADNLVWGTAKDNADDRERHGRTARGERTGNARFSAEIVKRIREYGAQGLGSAEIGRLVGERRARVHELLTRKTWKHL